MDKTIEQRFKDVLISTLEEDSAIIDNIKLEDSLVDYDMNSISFIKIVVALEKEFDIEFDDEQLNAEQFATFEDIVNNIASKINES
ncbi:acyl carrier protein [Vallitalea guaymasensis]|uniref:acyl carrier protein n=1 Tax=Vallitalea guaymasensis TaxID=1185412 RepID=UPI00187D2880|nr:acyl carrier protein [Vallitalea guaymasensis]